MSASADAAARSARLRPTGRMSAADEPTAGVLGRVLEVCVALAVAVPPFIFGGREAYGQLVLAALVLAAGGLWAVRLARRGPCRIPLRRPEVFLPLAALALGVLTWVPVPPSLVRALSPGVARLLPAWADGSVAGWGGGWPHFSLAPGLSREGTFLFLLYAILFWVTRDTVRSPGAVRRLFGVFLLTGVGVAAVGLVHYLFWNGKFYGRWQLWWVGPERQVRIPFTNRNHFAGFLALTIAPGLAWLAWLRRRWNPVRARSAVGVPMRGRRPRDCTVVLAIAGITLVVACILLSQSRAGTLVCLASLATASGALFPAGSRRVSTLAAVLIGLAGLGIVFTFGPGNPLRRTAGLLAAGQSLDQLSNRRLWLWKGDLHALADFPVLGTGVGTHPYVCPVYLERAHHVIFTHAESLYVQVLMECGVVGAALLGLALFHLGRWCWRGWRQGGPAAGTASLAVGISLSAALVQGLVGFECYVPAYAAALAVLAGIACSLCRLCEAAPAESPVPPPRVTASMPGARLLWGSAVAAIWAGLVVSAGPRFVTAARVTQAWNAYFCLLPEAGEQGVPASRPQDLERQTEWLAQACGCGSYDPDHYYRLGLLDLQRFQQRACRGRAGLGLDEVRQGLRSGRFATPAAAEAWLRRLYGNDLELLEEARAHFRESLQCCPLLGPAYVRLAELCFLDGPPAPLSYCRQALLVRPNDPAVCLQVGMQSWLAGDRATAGRCWQRACQVQPDSEWKLLPLLVDQLPVREAVALIPLDFGGLKWLAREESRRGQIRGQQEAVAQAQRVVAEDPGQSKNPNAWAALHELYQEAGMPAEAESCLRRALRLAPGQVGYHLQLIRWLMDQGRCNDALDQAHCARERFPGHPEVQRLVAEILSKRPVRAETNVRRTNRS